MVVDPGQPTPEGLGDARRVAVDEEVARHPEAAAEVLHRDFVARRPVVVELAADNAELRRPETTDRAPYELPERFAFHRERLHFLIWANNYDARPDDGPIWWHGVLARRAGLERPDPGGPGDTRLPDGRPVWCDGGPRGPVSGLELPLVHRESLQLHRSGQRPAGPAGLPVLSGPVPPRADDITHLADDQLAAVAHGSGPARVIAPAGSGKTRVLVARLNHLLADRGYEPELVTAVAYNNRAAAEMRTRASADRSTVRTLHSLGLWICGLDRSRRTVEPGEVRSMLERFVTTGRVPNRDPLQPYLEALGEVRLGLRPPEAVEAERDDVSGFAEAFDRYRTQLDRRDLLDFDEQIYAAIELLLTRPDIRATAQRACTHLLVDEFQDLTPAFLLLVRLVSAPSWQVFGVGDDDQVIYGYAGATPRYLVDFDRWFPGADEHALEVNYRCPPAVVEAAARLVGHNRIRVDKTIRPGPRAPAAASATAPADG